MNSVREEACTQNAFHPKRRVVSAAPSRNFEWQPLHWQRLLSSPPASECALLNSHFAALSCCRARSPMTGGHDPLSLIVDVDPANLCIEPRRKGQRGVRVPQNHSRRPIVFGRIR